MCVVYTLETTKLIEVYGDEKLFLSPYVKYSTRISLNTHHTILNKHMFMLIFVFAFTEYLTTLPANFHPCCYAQEKKSLVEPNREGTFST